MFFEEFKALIAKTLWQKAHTQVHAEHSGNNLIRFFTSESKHSLCLSRAWIWQTKGNVFLHICCICSESFPALLFLHFPSLYPISCSWMRQCRRYLIFFSSAPSLNSRQAKASIERAPVWRIIIEGDIAWFWHIGNARSAIVISADGSPITFSCHLSSQCRCNIIIQQRGAIAILVFHFTTMQIICSSYITLLVLDNVGCIPAASAQIPIFQSVGISKSTVFTDRDRASECPFPLICYMNIKQLCVTVKAGYDL